MNYCRFCGVPIEQYALDYFVGQYWWGLTAGDSYWGAENREGLCRSNYHDKWHFSSADFLNCDYTASVSPIPRDKLFHAPVTVDELVGELLVLYRELA